MFLILHRSNRREIMHPFEKWLKTNQHVIPFIISKGMSDWINIENGNSFSQFLADQKISLHGLEINKIRLAPNATTDMYGLYCKSFKSGNLKALPQHSQQMILTAERKRHTVLNECDDLLALYICNQDYLNQVQFWALRYKASTNAILMNIASISIITSLAQRCKTQSLTNEELTTLNNGELINWNESEKVQSIHDRIIILLGNLVGFRRVAFKNLTAEQIENPDDYYNELTQAFQSRKQTVEEP